MSDINEELAMRLEILESSETISKEVANTMRQIIARFASQWKIALDEENGSRLVTHLAMALMRIAKGEPVGSMDPEAYEEFVGCDSFLKASEITQDLIAFAHLQLPDSEREFLETNICLILEE